MDEITKVAAQPAAKEVQQLLQGDIKGLKEKSIQFIKEINRLMKGYERIEMMMFSAAADIDNIYSQMKGQNTLASQLVQAQYNFEKNLNNFLGRKIHLVWVDQKTGKIYFADEADAAEIYKEVSSARAGNISMSVDVDKLKNAPDMLNEKIQKLVKEREKEYNLPYRYALNRWDQNANPTNRWYKEHYKQFYWNEGTREEPEWKWSAKGINRGHISEAYINMIMRQRMSYDIVYGNIEFRLKAYSLYMDQHNILNNKAGISEGDVILTFENVNEGSVQFAVKTTGADTAKIGPYIYAAYEIINLANEIELLQNQDPINQIKKLLKNIPTSSTFRKNILTKSKKELTEIVDNIIKL